MAKQITLTLTPAQADLMERLVVEHQNDTSSNRTAAVAEAVLRKLHAAWMKPEDQPKATDEGKRRLDRTAFNAWWDDLNGLLRADHGEGPALQSEAHYGWAREWPAVKTAAFVVEQRRLFRP